MEAELIKQTEELKIKSKQLEEKEKLLQEKEIELEELRNKLKEKEDTPPLTKNKTPKPLGERGSSLRGSNHYGLENPSVFKSLKQEIKDLNTKMSYQPTAQTRLKKQVS